METPETALDRIVRMGIRSASPVDLVAVMASPTKAPGDEEEDLARAMLRRYGINMIGNLGPADLQQMIGGEEYQALRLLAAIELGRRSGLSAKGQVKTISGPDDIAALFAHLADENREHFCAVLLNSKNGIIGIRTIHIGTVGMSVVGPREVFREAIREGAASIVVVHNHPSGDPEPSQEDIDITVRLAGLGRTLEIPLHDHIIIGHHDFVSLRRRRVI